MTTVPPRRPDADSIDARDDFNDAMRALGAVARILRSLAIAREEHEVTIGADELAYLATRIDEHRKEARDAFEQLHQIQREAAQ